MAPAMEMAMARLETVPEVTTAVAAVDLHTAGALEQMT
jgi:hypothetical protein